MNEGAAGGLVKQRAEKGPQQTSASQGAADVKAQTGAAEQ